MYRKTHQEPRKKWWAAKLLLIVACGLAFGSTTLSAVVPSVSALTLLDLKAMGLAAAQPRKGDDRVKEKAVEALVDLISKGKKPSPLLPVEIFFTPSETISHEEEMKQLEEHRNKMRELPEKFPAGSGGGGGGGGSLSLPHRGAY